jgi:formylglycine-generating enzyme required for sulfatase activity
MDKMYIEVKQVSFLLLFASVFFVQSCTNGQEIEMIFVKGGTYIMGCTVEQGDDCRNNEKPVHQVTLSDFYIGKYEVTQVEWTAVMGYNISSHKNGDNLPVDNVTWNEVQEFIDKLNSRTSNNYRLPTEAEWEYAARGGTQSQRYKYSGSNDVNEVAWCAGDQNIEQKIHPTGAKRANELNIHDMNGNVWELCSDFYAQYDNIPQINPKGLNSGSGHVMRGGSIGLAASSVRIPCRMGVSPDFRNAGIGFRLVRTPK